VEAMFPFVAKEVTLPKMKDLSNDVGRKELQEYVDRILKYDTITTNPQQQQQQQQLTDLMLQTLLNPLYCVCELVI
jgi:hypothetical protein